MIIGTWLSSAQKNLQQASIPSGRLDSELLIAYVLGNNRAWVLAHFDYTLSDDEKNQLDKLLSRRLHDREPLVHLTGEREFYGLNLNITPDVLTPRVETEQIVEWTIRYAPQGANVIDIGTGSGAIAIAIKKHRPDIKMSASEISTSAMSVARMNAKKYSVHIEFIESNLWDKIPNMYDVVCTNLPYLRNDAKEELMDEVKKEPAVALFGGQDGLDLYRKFLTDLPGHLAPGGYLFTECDPWQHDDLIGLAKTENLKTMEQGYFILGFQQSTS